MLGISRQRVHKRERRGAAQDGERAVDDGRGASNGPPLMVSSHAVIIDAMPDLSAVCPAPPRAAQRLAAADVSDRLLVLAVAGNVVFP